MLNRFRFSLGLIASVLLISGCTYRDLPMEVAAYEPSTELRVATEPQVDPSPHANGKPEMPDQPEVNSNESQNVDKVEQDLLITSTPKPPLVQGEWMEFPVIPKISDRALAIYYDGIANGNDPHAFSKVGDCQNVPSMFVSIFDHPGFYTLGPEYEYLLETIEWYQGSFEHESYAVKRGFNAASVVSPLWADPESCETGEDPLRCEIRIHNPSVALVSLETWWAGNPDNYEKYVRQIIETLIDHSVLPVLATKADNQEGDHSINQILAELAYEYEIPLWNFWLAVQPLPDHGLMEDGFHLTFAPNYFDDPDMMKAAWPWRNLTALQVLHTIREAVEGSSSS